MNSNLISHLTIIKSKAIRDYRISFCDITLLRRSENTTFQLTDLNGKKYILRINRSDYHTFCELNGELCWMKMLEAETELILPHVYLNIHGSAISACPDGCDYGQFYSVFSYIDGTSTDVHTLSEQTDLLYEIGKTAAIMHSQVIHSPEAGQLCRFHWDIPDLIGPQSRWGNWEIHPLLTENQKHTFHAYLSKIIPMIESYGKTNTHFGIIHGDLHPGNFIKTKKGLAIIDFDDCGYGYFLYEIGCSLMQYNDNLKVLANAWISGYETIRTLSPDDKKMLIPFILFRRIIRIAWMASHADSDTAKASASMETYISITDKLCTDFLNHSNSSIFI